MGGEVEDEVEGVVAEVSRIDGRKGWNLDIDLNWNSYFHHFLKCPIRAWTLAYSDSSAAFIVQVEFGHGLCRRPKIDRSENRMRPSPKHVFPDLLFFPRWRFSPLLHISKIHDPIRASPPLMHVTPISVHGLFWPPHHWVLEL